jgi:hypothetical protein
MAPGDQSGLLQFAYYRTYDTSSDPSCEPGPNDEMKALFISDIRIDHSRLIQVLFMRMNLQLALSSSFVAVVVVVQERIKVIEECEKRSELIGLQALVAMPGV